MLQKLVKVVLLILISLLLVSNVTAQISPDSLQTILNDYNFVGQFIPIPGSYREEIDDYIDTLFTYVHIDTLGVSDEISSKIDFFQPLPNVWISADYMVRVTGNVNIINSCDSTVVDTVVITSIKKAVFIWILAGVSPPYSVTYK